MLTVETIRKIRLAVERDGKSLHQTARDLRVSRNTVRKVIRNEQTAFEYRRRVQPMPVTAKVAHIRLCKSRYFLVVAYPRETQEMVFDAHIRAFNFFGGVCRRGIYDNMKTAVNKILGGKQRSFNSGRRA